MSNVAKLKAESFNLTPPNEIFSFVLVERDKDDNVTGMCSRLGCIIFSNIVNGQ